MTEMEAEQLASSMLNTLKRKVDECFEDLVTDRFDPTQKLFGRVPSQLCEDDWHPFDPKVVSIGPLHMGKPQLEEMQKSKWECMARLLQQHSSTSEPEIYLSEQASTEIYLSEQAFDALNPYLKKCVSAVRELEESARGYHRVELPHNKDEFTEMLVLDACFLIQCCCYGYDGSDSDEFDELVLHNILLIENQIPFDVLKAVYLSVFPDNEPKELVVGLRAFFFPNEGFSYVNTDYINLLDFYCENLCDYQHNNIDYQHNNMVKLKNYICYPCKFFVKKLLCDQSDVGLPMVMKTSTAAECVEAGIHIKATNRRSFIPQIMFTNGTLTIQHIEMNHLTYSTLRNITLAEEWRGRYQRPMSEYACFLCSLVKSEADYKVLEEKGVLSADSINEGMLMFDRLKRLPLRKLHPEGRAYWIRDSIKKYVAEPHHRWRVNLVRDHFDSPWSIIGLVIGFVLLTLSIIQTVYTVLGYYYNKN